MRVSHCLVLVVFGAAYRQSITGFGTGTIAALIGRQKHLLMAVSRISSADARASDCLCVNNNGVEYSTFFMLAFYTARANEADKP
jgi:hypothetical protein